MVWIYSHMKHCLIFRSPSRRLGMRQDTLPILKQVHVHTDTTNIQVRNSTAWYNLYWALQSGTGSHYWSYYTSLFPWRLHLNNRLWNMASSCSQVSTQPNWHAITNKTKLCVIVLKEMWAFHGGGGGGSERGLGTRLGNGMEMETNGNGMKRILIALMHY